MSGGTTGTPKGTVSDHRSLVMTGIQISTWLHEPLANGASIMLPLPLFHAYGSGAALPAAMLGRATLILVPNPRDISDVVKTIEHEKPSVLCAVPTLLNALLAHPKVAARKADFSSIEATFSGAAALLAETKKRFEDITGGRIIEAYSLTEATLAASVNPYRGPNKLGSVGLPLPDVHMSIVDADDWTRELPAGQTGEIVIRAPQLMRRYWTNPEETTAVLRRDGDGTLALLTGDLGYFDDDGYLFIVDRKKDLIKTSGCQVWPREIEEVIATHPAVGEVGVAGVPDARKGEVVMAWIVLRAEATLTAADIRAFCADKLAPYKIPARVEIRKELPKTLVGKVLRRALVAEVKEQTSGVSDSHRGRTGPEDRPVERRQEALVRRLYGLERERELRGAVTLQMRQPLLGLVDARDVAGRNPPHGHVRTAEVLEPGATSAQKLGMRRPIDVVLQRLDRLPDRQIDENPIVLIRPQIGGVPFRRLQPPDKAGAVIREGVDLLEPRHEPFQDGGIERSFHAGDVDLGDVMVAGHVQSSSTSMRHTTPFRNSTRM
jgi:long-subunit acyl-CoA synthetase (AMP-forming)